MNAADFNKKGERTFSNTHIEFTGLGRCGITLAKSSRLVQLNHTIDAVDGSGHSVANEKLAALTAFD